MDDNRVKTPAKRRNKFAEKEDISRQATDNIITGQIDKLNEVSNKTNEATTKLRESVELLAIKKISVDTGPFEQLARHFIAQMEYKVKKVKQPSRGLKWYIAMWVITIISAFLAGYYIQATRKWKDIGSGCMKTPKNQGNRHKRHQNSQTINSPIVNLYSRENLVP